MRERVGLARPSAGDDEQRARRKAGTARATVRSGFVLSGIQALAEGFDERGLDVRVHRGRYDGSRLYKKTEVQGGGFFSRSRAKARPTGQQQCAEQMFVWVSRSQGSRRAC